MRVLLHLLQPGYARNYESTIRLLAARGHEVHLVYPHAGAKQAGQGLPERIAADLANVTVAYAPKRSASDRWADAAWWIRMLTDTSRLVHPRYAGAPLLRERPLQRLERKMPNRPKTLLSALMPLLLRRLRGSSSIRTSERLISFWLRLESAVPPPINVMAFLRKVQPDVVLVTPLVNVGSIQVDYVKSAHALGIPVGLCVASWDNLTNKGLIRVQPDRVFVWNEIQRREAIELQRVEPDRVVVTGAQRFDDWFTQSPSRTRKSFSTDAGLVSDRPYLLYLCSSGFIAPDEVSFVRRWLEALREADNEVLRTIPVLIRPHPQNAEQWRGVDLTENGDVAIWPRIGADPVDMASRADFFDSMAHSAAVVGINTSALIESAIAGKSVFTILAPEFAGTQEGTLHFHYLLANNGGFLHVASSLEEHVSQLGSRLQDNLDDSDQIRAFVESFVRPHGLERPATPILTDSIEALARENPLSPKVDDVLQRRLAELLLAALTAERPSLRGRSWRAKTSLSLIAFARSRPMAAPRTLGRRHPRIRASVWRLINAVGTPPTPDIMNQADAKRVVKRIRAAGRPLVFGPWTGGADLEVLYWLPFLRWAVERFNLDPTEIAAVSLTGAESWYSDIAAEFMRPPEFTGRFAERETLSPVALKKLWLPDRRGGAVPRDIIKISTHVPLSAPPTPDGLELPDDFFAFDLSATPAFSGEGSALLSKLSEIADGVPVVLLRGANSETATPLTHAAPEDVNALLSAIVARSRGVITGYGLTSHLALLYEVPVVALYDRPQNLQPTVEIVERLVRVYAPPFTLVETRALGPLTAAFKA